MSRYIDADAVCELFEPFTDAFTDVEVTSAYVQTLTLLANAPSIDIVRCKECRWIRYCETEDLDMYLDCDKPDGGGIPRNEEWFCADGEREGE